MERQIDKKQLDRNLNELSTLIEDRIQSNPNEYKNTFIQVATHVTACINYSPTDNDKENLERFNKGLLTANTDRLFFSPYSLLITINPKNGRPFCELDELFLMLRIKNNCPYVYATVIEQIIKVIKAPIVTIDEQLVKEIYYKGMELLPLYKDYII